MEALLLNGSGSAQQLLSHIVLNYLSQLYCVCVVWNSLDQAVDIDFDWIHEKANYPQMIWLKYEAFEGEQGNIDDSIRIGIDNGCQAFIAAPNSITDFLDAFENVRYRSEIRYHLIHVIALPTSRDKSEDYIRQILSHSGIRDLPNILIISFPTRKNDSGNGTHEISFDLITCRFVSQHNSNETRLLDTFDVSNGTFIENADLFPDKFSNLEGRIIRAAFFNYKPYTMWKEVPAGLGNADLLDSADRKTLQIDGTESLLISAFCDLYNCTLAVSIEEVNQWGVVYNNWTGNGILGAVAERRAEIGLAALFPWFYEFLEISTSISRSGITCVCPKPSRLSGWLLSIEPFSSAMWTAELIAFVGIFIAITTVKTVINHAGSRVDVVSYLLQTFAIFMLQSTSIASRHMPEVIVGTTALLACLLIANAYGGGLASIMTVPQFEEPIDSVRQMVVKDINWGGTHDDWTISIQDAIQPDLQRLVTLFQAMSVETLSARTTTKDLCFVIERLPYGHYAVGDYIDENSLKYLRLMHYDMFYGYTLAMFYRTWPFKSVFDLHVMHVFESGIQRYWELISSAENFEVQLGISVSRDREKTGPISLSLNQVSGAFALLGIGCACATFVFIMELLWYRFKKVKTSDKNIIMVAPRVSTSLKEGKTFNKNILIFQPEV